MGVYIKDMEMPKSCSRCFCMASCRLWKNIMHPEFNRHRNCPLVLVPPHGRLVDADRLGFAMMDAANADQALAMVDDAPTVIEAKEVYSQYTDTAGNYHWCGTHSGEHTIKAEEGET